MTVIHPGIAAEFLYWTDGSNEAINKEIFPGENDTDTLSHQTDGNFGNLKSISFNIQEEGDKQHRSAADLSEKYQTLYQQLPDTDDAEIISSAQKEAALYGIYCAFEGKEYARKEDDERLISLSEFAGLTPLALLYAIYARVTAANRELQLTLVRGLERMHQAEAQLERERFDLYEQKAQKFLEAQESARKGEIANIAFDWIIGAVEVAAGFAQLNIGLATGNALMASGGAFLLTAGLIGGGNALLETLAFCSDDPSFAEQLKKYSGFARSAQTFCEGTSAVMGIGAAGKVFVQSWRGINNATRAGIQGVSKAELAIQNRAADLTKSTAAEAIEAAAVENGGQARMIEALERETKRVNTEAQGVLSNYIEGDGAELLELLEQLPQVPELSGPIEAKASIILEELTHQGWKNISKNQIAARIQEAIEEDALENIRSWAPKVWNKLAESEISTSIWNTLKTQGWQTVENGQALSQAKVAEVVKQVSAEVKLENAEQWAAKVWQNLAETEISNSIFKALEAQGWRKVTQEQITAGVKRVLVEGAADLDQLLTKLQSQLGKAALPSRMLELLSGSIQHLYVITNVTYQSLQVMRRIVSSVIGLKVARSEAQGKKLEAQGVFLKTLTSAQRENINWLLKQEKENAMRIVNDQTALRQNSRMLGQGMLRITNAVAHPA